MTLDRPWLLLLLGLIPLAVWLAGASRARLSVPRGALAAGLRALGLGAAVLALAGLTAGAGRPPVTIFAIDTSESVLLSEQAGALDAVDTFVRGFGDDAPVGVVQFAQRPIVLAMPGRLAEAPSLRTDLPPGATDLAAGLTASLSLIPDDAAGRIVVITDGNATRGDTEAVLQAAVARGVEISFAPVRALRGSDLAIGALRLPPDVRVGAPIKARIAIDSDRHASARLRLWDGPRLLTDGPIDVVPGLQEFGVDVGGLGVGFHRLRAELLEDADQRLANNVAEAFVHVRPPGAVLGVSTDGLPMVGRALLSEGLTFRTVSPAELGATELAGFDAILMSDVPAGALEPAAVDRIRDHVSAGHGLLVMGGPHSFAAGAYEDTALDRVLPVWSNPTEERPDPRLALVLVIDRSSSMASGATEGAAKIDLAIEAAIEAVSLLQEGDILGVLAFDFEGQWIVPPRPIEGPGALRSAIDGIRGIRLGSSTDLYLGMWMAQARLRRVDASIKHVVLLTDGKAHQGTFESLSRAMRQHNITVTSIAIGEDAERDLLESIARVGGGRFYAVDDPRNLPRVLTQETELAGDFAIVEREFQPRLVGSSPVLDGPLDGLEFPLLAGFVRTRAKPTAEIVLASDSNDPVLAHWQFGRGRAMAWTSDAGADWARAWAEWPGFTDFVRQAANWVMPPPGDDGSGLFVSTTVEAGRALIEIDSVDANGRFRNQLRTRLEIVDPVGARHPLVAEQVAPGRYAARSPELPPGVYELRVEQHDNADQVAAASSGFVIPAAAEVRRNRADTALLRRIASLTGGAEVRSTTELASLGLRGGDGWRASWPFFVTAALLLFTADVGVRRVRGSPTEIRERLSERVESLRSRARALRRLRPARPSAR